MGEPGFWRFWIANVDLSLWNGREVTLRIPPQNVETHRPIRAQVNQDLSRNPVVIVDGMGLVRWTLSGTHGAGVNGILVSTGRGQVSGGLRARYDLLDLFQGWAEENVERARRGEPLLKLMLTISEGGPSELPFEEWEILPDEAPRDRRSSGAPMAWNWSLSFWGLADLTVAKPGSSRDFLTQDQGDALKKADAGLAKVEADLSKPSTLARLGKAVAEKVRSFLRLVRSVRSAIKSALDQAKRLTQGLGDLALALAQESVGLLADVQTFFRDERDYVRGFARELRDNIRAARYIAGNLARASRRPWDRSMPEAYPVASPSSAPVRPGDSAQAMALRVYGDASRWQDLVALNGLDYPFFDFSGPNYTADPAHAAAGRKVLGAGDAVNLPLVQGMERPADPIGWDRNEAGPLALVVGKANLSAALLRRLRTPGGWLPYHPEYGAGLNRHLGRTLALSGVLELRRDVATALRMDPRVLRVTSVKARVDADAIYVDSEVETPLGLVQVAGPLTA